MPIWPYLLVVCVLWKSTSIEPILNGKIVHLSIKMIDKQPNLDSHNFEHIPDFHFRINFELVVQFLPAQPEHYINCTLLQQKLPNQTLSLIKFKAWPNRDKKYFPHTQPWNYTGSHPTRLIKAGMALFSGATMHLIWS